jgi:hypothetical protein
MIPVWPADLPQTPQRGSFSGGPKNSRVSFQPDRGPPIDRLGDTAETLQKSAVFPQIKTATLDVFRAWFSTDLRRGTLPYAWRDPIDGLAWRWKIVGEDLDYEEASRGATLHDLTLRLLRLPGRPWWQPYCTATGALRLPYVVADYTNGVFGVDLARTPASVVAALAGTLDLYTTATGGAVTEELAHAVIAGDIPATAPGGVAKIVGYLP